MYLLIVIIPTEGLFPFQIIITRHLGADVDESSTSERCISFPKHLPREFLVNLLVNVSVDERSLQLREQW